MTTTIIALTPDRVTRAYAPTMGRIEDVDWLLDFGTSWHEICRRLGLTPGALQRYCYRHGRVDLARSIQAAARRSAVGGGR